MGRPRADDAEPIAVMRAHDLEPLDPYPGSKPQWRATCTRCGNEVFPRLVNVRKGNRNCPTCRRDPRMLTDDEALAILTAAGLEPLAPYPGVKHPWPARCLGCGRETSPTLNGLKAGHGGCRWCGWKRGAAKKKVPQAVAVEAMRAAGLEPLEAYTTTMTPWRCRCLGCGAIVTPSHNSVTNGRGGCRACGIQKGALARMHSDAEARALMRAAGVEPLEPYPGANIPWACRCITCDAHVSPRLTGIVQGQGGCSACGYRNMAAKRRMPEEEARRRLMELGLEALEPYPGRNMPWRSRCLGCGSTCTPRLGNLAVGTGGCRGCSWDTRMPGRSMAVYLVTHAEWNAVKVGIGVCNGGKVPRLRFHTARGWTVDTLITDVATTALAFEAERAVLADWDARDVRGYVDPSRMPYHGSTETAPLDLDLLLRAREIIHEVTRGTGDLVEAS